MELTDCEVRARELRAIAAAAPAYLVLNSVRFPRVADAGALMGVLGAIPDLTIARCADFNDDAASALAGALQRPQMLRLLHCDALGAAGGVALAGAVAERGGDLRELALGGRGLRVEGMLPLIHALGAAPRLTVLHLEYAEDGASIVAEALARHLASNTTLRSLTVVNLDAFTGPTGAATAPRYPDAELRAYGASLRRYSSLERFSMSSRNLFRSADTDPGVSAPAAAAFLVDLRRNCAVRVTGRLALHDGIGAESNARYRAPFVRFLVRTRALVHAGRALPVVAGSPAGWCVGAAPLWVAIAVKAG